MYQLDELQDIVKNKFKELKFEGFPKELYQPLSYTFESGGKRIRPTLLLASCNMFTDDLSDALHAAVGFEVFHNFTLLHDDIMDNSPVRRNKPTVHKKWNENIAILSGDLMMIKAYNFFLHLSDNKLKIILELFNKTAAEVCEGQQFDMNFETREDVSIDEYINMIKLKTSVLIAACTKAGAIMGNASGEDCNLLYDFGLYMGLAFQLQDDLLDTYGDFEKFGKRIGNDILEAKKTFLLIKTQEKASEEDRGNLLKILHDKNISNEEKISYVIVIYNKYNIKEETQKEILKYYNKAINALNKVSVSGNKKNVLFKFAEQISKRVY